MSSSTLSTSTSTMPTTDLNKYIKYINFIIVYIVTFSLVFTRNYEIIGMGLLLSFNFVIQSFLLYDIFSIKDAYNNVFIFTILIGISLTLISSIFILKMLIRIQNKNHEAKNTKLLIDKDLNPKYHLFSNLFVTDVTLILVNSIIYFSYRFSNENNIKYKNDYLYNEMEYDVLDYSFLKNIYYRTNEFFEDKKTNDGTNIMKWFIVLYPLAFAFFLVYNVFLTIFINLIKTINSLITDFFKTISYLFKALSLIAILVISCINLYLSSTLSTIHMKTLRKKSIKKGGVKYKIPASALNNNGIFSHIEDIFNNLNMNYLVNYKVSV
jgi:hypothetical protein